MPGYIRTSELATLPQVDGIRAHDDQVASAGAVRPARAPIARRVAIVATIFVALGMLLLSRAPMCPLAALTHLPCPGCGLTRSTLAIARGDLGAAFDMQPFAFVMSPLLAVAVVTVVSRYVRSGHATFSPRFGRFFLPSFALLFLAMFAFWVARFFGVHGGPVPV